MSETLYRKYRPTSFADVAGQDHVKTILMNQLKQDTVAHAYLFAGPRGVGKTTIARLLAKAVNCSQLNDGDPCGVCTGCLAVSEGKTMDVFEIDAASHTGVDNVRENVIEAARFAPTTLKRKVFIIDEVHGLSTPAFNALLKTLEEPPAHVLFILATTELHKVPETILSRCQRFDFHRLSADIIVDRLTSLAKQEHVNVEADVFASIARLSEGCLRDAESLLGQVLALGDGKTITMAEASLMIPATNIGAVLAYLTALSNHDSIGAVVAVRTALETGTRIEPLQEEVLEALQWMLLNGMGSQQTSSVYDAATIKQLQQIGSSLTVSGVSELIKRLLEYRQAFQSERIPELPLELVAVETMATTSTTVPRATRAPVLSVPTPVPAAPAPVSAASEHTEKREAPVPPPPVLAEEPPHAASCLTCTIDDIKHKWSECCSHLSEISGTLPVMLQDIEFLGIDGSTLRIGTKVGFIAEKLNQPKNRGLIADVLCRVFGQPMAVNAEHIQVPQEELVSELIGAFGGKVL